MGYQPPYGQANLPLRKILSGRVFVQDGYGRVYNPEEVPRPRYKNLYGVRISRIQRKFGTIMSSTNGVEKEVLETNPDLDTSLVGLDKIPQKPFYYQLQFDDGTIGDYIHEKFVQKGLKLAEDVANYLDDVRGRVYVENGFGAYRLAGDNAVDGFINFVLPDDSFGPLTPIQGKFGVVIGETIISPMLVRKFPSIDTLKVGKISREFSPRYLIIKFDDGTTGYFIHQDFAKMVPANAANPGNPANSNADGLVGGKRSPKKRKRTKSKRKSRPSRKLKYRKYR
jgi:hypothetical protein